MAWWAAALAAAGAQALPPFPVYPGARVEAPAPSIYRRRDSDEQRKTTIYVTSDAYEKVRAFYLRRGREFEMPGGLGQSAALPDGRKLRQSYITLDGAAGLRNSKRWVKIQTPYSRPAWSGQAEAGEAPAGDTTAIMHVESR
jgi:hypothetical protein